MAAGADPDFEAARVYRVVELPRTLHEVDDDGLEAIVQRRPEIERVQFRKNLSQLVGKTQPPP